MLIHNIVFHLFKFYKYRKFYLFSLLKKERKLELWEIPGGVDALEKFVEELRKELEKGKKTEKE